MKKILCVVIVFCLFYSIRLDYPPIPYFDEFFYVPAAKAIGDFSGYLQNRHPPLIHLCMALSMNIFGENSWAWRLPSLIFAGGATALAGYFAFLLSGRITLFWLVCALLSMDGLWITQARIGLPNSAMVFFILATLILWWKGHTDLHRRHFYWIFACASAGLAMACKWQGALVVFIPPLYYWFTKKNNSPAILNAATNIPTQHVHKRFPWIYGALAFLLSYLSVFTIIPCIKGMQWIDIFKLQLDIPTHHVFLHSVHRDASMWFTWPFLTRPVWYGYLNLTPGLPIGQQIVTGILCLGNPILFMLFIPSLFWIRKHASHHKNPLSFIAIIGILIFWLPSIIMGKTGLFYHFFPALPFMTILIAIMIDEMWESTSEQLPYIATLLVILIFLAYIFFFPLWTALPINDTYFNQHLWFKSWR